MRSRRPRSPAERTSAPTSGALRGSATLKR